MDPKDLLAPPAPPQMMDGLPDGLPAREQSVLQELARVQGGHIAFQALRRRLNLHPQALTRTLRHLESDGLVLRDELGYQLAAPAGALPAPGAPITERVPAFAALAPPHLEPDQVAAQLQQRWFHGLRWYGINRASAETVLTWTTEDTGQPVRLRIAGSMIGVELETTGGPPDLAKVAPLLQALAVLYGKPASSPRALTGSAQ